MNDRLRLYSVLGSVAEDLQEGAWQTGGLSGCHYVAVLPIWRGVGA